MLFAILIKGWETVGLWDWRSLMGELLEFKRRAPGETRAVEAGSRSAEILFFLGVRYERAEQPREGAEGGGRGSGGGARKAPGRGKKRA
jgi:hypothetical protein